MNKHTAKKYYLIAKEFNQLLDEFNRSTVAFSRFKRIVRYKPLLNSFNTYEREIENSVNIPKEKVPNLDLDISSHSLSFNARELQRKETTLS